MKIKPQNASAKPGRKSAKQPRRITPDYLHNSGLFYLQRFASSVANFESVMLRKVQKSCRAHPDQDFQSCVAMVHELIKKFERAGLLDDAVYAKAMISTLRRQGKSKRTIILKLTQKGLNPENLKSLLLEYDEEHAQSPQEAEFLAAVKFARKKRLGPFKETPRRTIENEMAAMGRAGFSYDVIRKVFAMSRNEAEDFLHQGS